MNLEEDGAADAASGGGVVVFQGRFIDAARMQAELGSLGVDVVLVTDAEVAEGESIAADEPARLEVAREVHDRAGVLLDRLRVSIDSEHREASADHHSSQVAALGQRVRRLSMSVPGLPLLPFALVEYSRRARELPEKPPAHFTTIVQGWGTLLLAATIVAFLGALVVAFAR